MTHGPKGLIVLLIAGLMALPAAADWLVLTDGSRVETAGPWELRGRLVVFTAASGELASLRVNDVDLEASEQATTAALEAAAAREARAREPLVEPAPRAPVLVLTDDDVSHVPEEEPGAAESEETERPSGLRLNVADWDQEESPDGNGVAVVGTLRNDGRNVATRIQMQVQVLDSQDRIVGTTTAQLTSTSLGAGDVLNFRAQFPDLVGFDTARFDISGREFRPAPPVTRPEDLGEDEALLDREPEPAVDPF